MKHFFIGIITIGTILLTACNSEASTKNTQNNVSVTEGKTDVEHATLGVQGNCELCKERIETAAKSVKGVSMADWDMKTKELHLNFDSSQTNLDTISKAIAKVGHSTDIDAADQNAYNALPACCKV